MTGKKLWARWVLAAALFGGFCTAALTGVAHAQTVVWKQCSKCNQVVPISSQAGQTCPHCGAYWGSQQTQYVPGGVTPNGRSPQNYGPTFFVPMPRNSVERIAFYQAMVRQQMIQQQMLRELMVRQERELRRQRMIEQAEKRREEKAKKQSQIREPLREERKQAQ